MKGFTLYQGPSLWELTEPYWSNGGFEPFSAGDANPYVGLSDAPCIAESMTVHDDGSKEICRSVEPWDAVPRFWYFGNYMIISYIDEMLEHGKVVFTLCK